MRIRKDGEAQASRDFAALRDSKKNESTAAAGGKEKGLADDEGYQYEAV
jgi:hypothetical protein